MVGKTLGHYEILEPLGKGGMGEVYRARDTKLNRDVAIKVLPEELADDADLLARLEREAHLLASLNHPNIATIHGLEKEEGALFLVLELVEGESLERRLARGPLPFEKSCDVCAQIGAALEAAHGTGIVHRDLKPANVLITPDGRIKLLDFGIAKSTGGATVGTENVTSLTATGSVVGTPTYMSPEQVRGEDIDHRADIWAFGCVMYETLAGKSPFSKGTVVDTLAAIVEHEPDWSALPPDLPPTIQSILHRSLQKDRDRRLRDIADARLEIEDAVQQPVGSAAAQPESGALKQRVRWPLRTALAIGIIAIAWVGWTQLGSWPGRGGANPALPEISVRQLTTTSGEDFGGTISPDGEWFAFTRRTEDSTRIFLQSVESRTAIQIHENGASPAFSSDGNRIAFSTPPIGGAASAGGAGLGGISIMGRLGDDARQLADFGFNPDWSPDGSQIVFGAEFVFSRPWTRSDLGFDLVVVDVETGSYDLLEVADGVQPAWSPNGHRIAYWGATTGQRDLFTVSVDDIGKEADDVVEVAVTSDPAVDFSPRWSPDGNWLYWVSSRSGALAIWRVAIDEVTGALLNDPQQVTTGGSGEPGMLSFSADGMRLLYTESLTRGSTLVADFDTETLTVSPDTVAVVEGSRRLMDGEISGDGQWIVYRTEGVRQDIFVARTDGTEERQLTDDLFKDWGPRWSPDGQRIVFYTNASGRYEVWVMNADGSRRIRLTDSDSNPSDPVWSPDGSRIIVFMGSDSLIIDPSKPYEAQQPEVIPRIPEVDEAFQSTDWHPEGIIVAGLYPRTGSNRQYDVMYLFNVETGEYTALGNGTAPRWMSDGRHLLAQETGRDQFFVMDSVTMETRLVAVPIPGVLRLTLSPDNRLAYLGLGEFQSDIWMLEMR